MFQFASSVLRCCEAVYALHPREDILGWIRHLREGVVGENHAVAIFRSLGRVGGAPALIALCRIFRVNEFYGVSRLREELAEMVMRVPSIHRDRHVIHLLTMHQIAWGK